LKIEPVIADDTSMSTAQFANETCAPTASYMDCDSYAEEMEEISPEYRAHIEMKIVQCFSDR
jgi:hypothetical protein